MHQGRARGGPGTDGVVSKLPPVRAPLGCDKCGDIGSLCGCPLFLDRCVDGNHCGWAYACPACSPAAVDRPPGEDACKP